MTQRAWQPPVYDAHTADQAIREAGATGLTPTEAQSARAAGGRGGRARNLGM